MIPPRLQHGHILVINYDQDVTNPNQLIARGKSYPADVAPVPDWYGMAIERDGDELIVFEYEQGHCINIIYADSA